MAVAVITGASRGFGKALATDLVAEKLIFGKTVDIPEEYATNRRAEWSTGPGSDLEVATNIARTMVQTLGMGKGTGLAVTAPNRQDPLGRSPFGDEVAAKTWVEVNQILEASYARVTARLTSSSGIVGRANTFEPPKVIEHAGAWITARPER